MSLSKAFDQPFPKDTYGVSQALGPHGQMPGVVG